MVTYKDAEHLLRLSAAAPVVLSLYLPVPLDPIGLRGVSARSSDLMAQACATADGEATGGEGTADCVSKADRDAVLGELAVHGREWLGRTVAFFACARLGLFEALPLPRVLPGRAVLAARPYVRPMLTALQRYPDYRVAIVDRQHAWLLSVSGDRVETFARQSAEGERSSGFGGWYGLESYRVQQRVIQLERRHYRDVAAVLSQPAGAGRIPPLVIGGHHESIAGLLDVLPPAVRDVFAGSFSADPHTLTPAMVRGLAQPVIDESVLRREQRLAGEILGDTPPRLAAVGLPACLAAVGDGAVAHLLVAHEEMISGFACGRCGALTVGPDECPDWDTAARAVPDLLEEMVRKVLDDGGLVTTLRDAPFTVAAKLRFPVTAEGTLKGEQ